jgi:hypothetical protein
LNRLAIPSNRVAEEKTMTAVRLTSSARGMDLLPGRGDRADAICIGPAETH